MPELPPLSLSPCLLYTSGYCFLVTMVVGHGAWHAGDSFQGDSLSIGRGIAEGIKGGLADGFSEGDAASDGSFPGFFRRDSGK